MGKTAQTLYDHVRELRLRLVYSALALMVGGAVGYFFHKQLIAFLSRPIHETLYYSSPAGGFNFVMKICLVIGLALALPVLIYNIIRFIAPAFGNKLSLRHAYLITVLSLILAAGGALFAFYAVVPMSLHFFQGFQTETIKPLLSANEYLTFVLNCVLSFMLIFQLPLFIIFTDYIKPIPPRKFLKYEKYVIVGSLVVALILPFTYDPLTQFLIAVPIIILYNLSAVLVVIVHRSRWLRKQIEAKSIITADNSGTVNQQKTATAPAIMSVESDLIHDAGFIRSKNVNRQIKPPTTLHQVMRSQTLARPRTNINDFTTALKTKPTSSKSQKPINQPKPILWDIVKPADSRNSSLNNTAMAE